MDSFITKLISDVTVKMSIKNLPLGNSTAAVMIPIEGDADVTKSSMKLYYDTDDIATDFDADSGVFAKAEALFAQDGFNGPIEVVTTQKGDVTVPVTAASVGNVDSTATGDGAEVTTGAVAETTTVPGIVKGISDYLWSGARYVVLPDDDDTATILAVGKYLYDNQHMILVASVKSIENLKTVHDEAVTWVADNHLGNTIVFVNKVEDEHPEARAVAYATQNIPLDWMHINLIDGITANDWTTDEYQQILDLNGMTTVNKAGDIMVSNSKAVDGSYVDNTFGAQYVNDGLQTGLQRFLNSQNLLAFDDDGIKLLKENATGIMQDIAKTGVIANGLDGKPIIAVEGADRTNTPNVDVAKRRYRSLKVSCTLVGSIETVQLTVAVTL